MYWKTLLYGTYFLLPFASCAFDGELDSTFGNNGIVESNFYASSSQTNALAINAANSILVVTSVGATLGIACYLANGALDTSFNAKGSFPGLTTLSFGCELSQGLDTVLNSEQKITVVGTAGCADSTHFALARLQPNGLLDSSFGGTGMIVTDLGGTQEVAYKVALADKRIVIAGVSNALGQPAIALACYCLDGSLDTTFNKTGKLVESSIEQYPVYSLHGLAIQPDGKIVVAGTFTAPEKFFIARYTAEGNLDTSFNGTGIIIGSFGGTSNGAKAFVLQPDGKIMVGGYSNAFGLPSFALARYHPSGMRDLSFNKKGTVITPLLADESEVDGIALQPDGKIVVVGTAATRTSFSVALARYISSGMLDSSFNPKGLKPGIAFLTFDSFCDASSIALQHDGNIVVSGIVQPDSFILARFLGK